MFKVAVPGQKVRGASAAKTRLGHQSSFANPLESQPHKALQLKRLPRRERGRSLTGPQVIKTSKFSLIVAN